MSLAKCLSLILVLSNQVYAGTIEAVAVADSDTASAEVGEPAVKISAEQAKSLKKEFLAAWKNATKALKHEQSVRATEEKRAMKLQNKQWRESEKKARRTYFEAHTKGAERRAYVMDYIQRKKEFESKQNLAKNIQAKERKSMREHFEVRKENSKKEFEEYLKKGEMPSKALWP